MLEGISRAYAKTFPFLCVRATRGEKRFGENRVNLLILYKYAEELFLGLEVKVKPASIALQIRGGRSLYRSAEEISPYNGPVRSTDSSSPNRHIFGC